TTGAVDISFWQGPIRDRCGSLGKPRQAIQSRAGFFQRLHPAEMSESAGPSAPRESTWPVHGLGITLLNCNKVTLQPAHVLLGIITTRHGRIRDDRSRRSGPFSLKRALPTHSLRGCASQGRACVVFGLQTLKY